MQAMHRSVAAALLAAGILFAPCAVQAGAILKNPADTVALGLNDNGSLNVTAGSISVNGGATGIAFKFADGKFYDATSPGCLCEGWGVSVNGTVAGYANMDDSTTGVNLTYGALTGVTASTATSTVSLTSLPGLTVIHQVQPATAAPATLFRMHVTIRNTTGAAVNDVKYVRVMDWDVPPTEFSELVTIRGVATTTLLERSHDDGFETGNPLTDSSSGIMSGTLNTDFTKKGPDDHGAYFRFRIGTIADGGSFEGDIYYGAAATESAALAAITAEGIELYSLGQSNGTVGGAPATYVFGFKGVGGIPVGGPVAATEIPTLSQWGLILLTGLIGASVALVRRARRRTA
jgi:hypothetical protein